MIWRLRGLFHCAVCFESLLWTVCRWHILIYFLLNGIGNNASFIICRAVDQNDFVCSLKMFLERTFFDKRMRLSHVSVRFVFDLLRRLPIFWVAPSALVVLEFRQIVLFADEVGLREVFVWFDPWNCHFRLLRVLVKSRKFLSLRLAFIFFIFDCHLQGLDFKLGKKVLVLHDLVKGCLFFRYHIVSISQVLINFSLLRLLRLDSGKGFAELGLGFFLSQMHRKFLNVLFQFIEVQVIQWSLIFTGSGPFLRSTNLLEKLLAFTSLHLFCLL